MELSPASCVDRFSSHMRSAEQAEPQTTIRIGILGCGSRGLTVLERLCALAATSERRVDISVFDPHRPGPGLHSVEQPAYLMLNTVASQISMFPDQAALGGYTGRHGPDFYQWCLRFKSADRVVQPNEFLPRAWLGEYLAWTYEEVIRTLPEQVRVTHHARLVDNVEHMDLGGFILSTGAQKHQVDWLLVTVGHAETGVANDKTEGTTQRYNAYPQPHCLSGISSTAHVGIEGLGLSAMDVVAGLTVGRGGRFVEGPEGLCYRACGQEPQLYMYSRSGSPYRARPDIAPHRIGASPLIFTLSAVADLRTQHPEGLDFEMQVLPLLKAEMYAEYFAVIAMLQGESSLRIKSEVATAYWLGEIDDKTRELAQRFAVPMLSENVFNPRHLQAPVDNYPQWVRSFIQDDLNESLRGLDHSPVKAAVEVWRSCREQLRRAVDNQGLKPESHQTFFNEYAPLVNRMVAGPQKERHQELLALADAGIVHWVHGSNVMHSADCKAVAVMTEEGEVVPLNAWVCAHGGNSNAAPPEIIRQLLGNGIIHNLGERGAGVYIDSHGKALPNLWVTGPIVEGATYYNHYVPASGSYSRAFADADRIAREMLGMTVSA
ncbi:FAD/NAD(P)-binding protein [Pseudomonas sp. LP_7_YM]|uniref:FAD/NAD(P)-binding protein n=1 Tax=Pseudomonas sp. LP_7_YM TaxID=2485137 RepID=UPI0010609819|nr:FAD/NAD(P)-binding protein [Pseudomonas sp. LP_7_YM]TDV64320.1 FAD-NAD(P)-binding protein [Pseudomonas sp. LP_7_YM]